MVKCFKNKRILAILLAAIMVLCIMPFTAYAENYQDAPPYIQPVNPNGLKILFDNSHAQTAGAADWVIDGGFSDFAYGLAAHGYYVKELRKNTPLVYSDLSGYDVFVISEANNPFKATEQAAILQYVQGGGSVFFIADHYNSDRNKNRWDSSEVFNGYRRGAYANPALGMSVDEANSSAMSGVVSSDWLSSNFGVRFRYNALGDISANVIVSPSQCFGITTNVSAVAMHAGSTLAITNPNVAKGIVYLPNSLTVNDKWPSAVDNGVYNNGGVAEGPYVAISKVGAGKAAFIGDSSPVEDATPKYRREETGTTKTTYDGYLEDDDAVLLVQLIDWLASHESYTSFSQTGIALDAATALYSYEIPANSTEPQAEPWAAPAVGYKWYDTSTYKSGSYGYTGANVVTPYTLSMPTQIVSGKEQPVTIYFEGLQANTTYSAYNIGGYSSSGTQIGMFREYGASWPSSYGYSSQFSITTDAKGEATKTLFYKINPTFSGDFNLRLRQNTSNLVTETRTAIQESNSGLPAVGTPVYSLNIPEIIKSGKDTAVTVCVRNLNPNQVISNLNVGIYLTGGTQIAKFSEDGTTWTSSFGYSNNFELTADANGVATKTLSVRMKTNSDGSANIRLRTGSANTLTQSITVE
ncbi:MAG: hypothetical protein LBH95_01410 [Oscillospiraceae bacterium]|nr:hypothetical protein [Oscillospiraceae bacterium]